MEKGGQAQAGLPFRHEGPAVFAFAGRWDRWSRLKGTILESFTILTTTPNGLLQDVHDRMLVILHGNHYETWLAIERPRLKELLLPFEAELMTVYEVSSLVNRPQNDRPACVERVVSTNSLFAGVY